MQVAVVGTGNVGCALLCALSQVAGIDQVFVASRRKESALAAILDVASADPRAAAKMHYTNYESACRADVIVLTAGVQMEKGQKGSDVLGPNLRIAESFLAAAPLKESAITICLATPVDYLTPYVQKKSKLPEHQCFGFGGDLDRNRLEYVIRNNHPNAVDARIVGEHGGNAIPVYSREKDYASVSQSVRKFLSQITHYDGKARNLATGYLLAQLVDSIVNDTRQIHYVCGYHETYGVYLTWPYVIGRTGVIAPDAVSLEINAQKDLDALVATRKSHKFD